MAATARQTKFTRFWKWIMGSTLLLSITLCIAFLPRKQNLLEQSTITANIQNWWIDPYHWLSDHQILFSRWPGKKEGLYCYDTQTQKEIFLGAVSREMQKADFPMCLDSLRVSPDGTRILWEKEKTVCGAWLDGSHYFTCVPRRYPGSASFTQVRWTSDSRHWVAFVSDQHGATQAMLYDEDASHKARTVATTASDQSDPLEAMGLISTQSLVLNDHLVACEWYGNQGLIPAVDILDIGLGIPATNLKTRHVSLPPNDTVQEIVISPQGDRIAWHLTMQAVPQWMRFVHRLLPRIALPEQSVESFWVSQVDGTQMHEIGRRNLERTEKSVPQLAQLQWVPGGKRLSFRYRNTLYTVSAEWMSRRSECTQATSAGYSF